MIFGPARSACSAHLARLAQPAKPAQPAIPAVQPQPEVTAGLVDNPELLQFQPVVGPQSVVDQAAAAAMETYEAYTAAVASAAVDLDSETDSNHDTALTLACAGGHEELVTLLINRGANIGTEIIRQLKLVMIL